MARVPRVSRTQRRERITRLLSKFEERQQRNAGNYPRAGNSPSGQGDLFDEENLPQDHLPPESKRPAVEGGPGTDSE